MLLKEAKEILKENNYNILPKRPASKPTPDNITYHSINPDYELINWYDELYYHWTLIRDKDGEQLICNGKME